MTRNLASQDGCRTHEARLVWFISWHPTMQFQPQPAKHQALHSCATPPAVRRQLGSKRVWQPRLAALNVAQQLELVGACEGGPAHHLWAGTGGTGKEVAVGSGDVRTFPAMQPADGVFSLSANWHTLQACLSFPTALPAALPAPTSSYRMAPMDHRSALASYLWKCRISGAMYSGLPHSVSARPCGVQGSQAANPHHENEGSCVAPAKHKQACSRPGVRADRTGRQPNPHSRTCGCRLRANPKSAIFSVALAEASDSSRFCGFRSRCGRRGEDSRRCRSVG